MIKNLSTCLRPPEIVATSPGPPLVNNPLHLLARQGAGAGLGAGG